MIKMVPLILRPVTEDGKQAGNEAIKEEVEEHVKELTRRNHGASVVFHCN